MHAPNGNADPARLAAALIDAWNAHDIERVVVLYASDYEGEDVAEPAPLRGHAAVRRSAERYLRAFPDLRWSVERVLAQGETVVLVWTAQGTHKGTLLHIPPTGRLVEVRGISVLEVDDGRVRRGTVVWDVAGLLRAVGLLPDLQLEA